MKRIYPLVLPLTPIAVVIGLVLLPSHEERSEQLLHDGRFEAAEPLLESRFEKGDRSPRVVQGIARARISQGDIQSALTFFENPEVQAKAPADLVREYETGLLNSFAFDAYRALKSDDNSAETIRQVGMISALSGDLVHEREALEKLSESDRATPSEILRLALIESRLGDSSAAVSRVDHLIELYPDYVTAGVIELLATFAHSAGPEAKEKLQSRVLQFIDRYPKSDVVWQLGWSLIEGGHPDVATNVLLSRGDAIFRDEKLLEVVSAALAKSSRQRELLPAVERNLRNGTVNESIVRTLVAAKIYDRGFLAAVSGAFEHDRVSLQDETAEQLAALASERFGDQEIAIQFLRKVAAHNPPHHTSMRALVFLWGPVANAGALNWLEQRAASSSGTERIAWIEHILNLGGEQRALDLLEESPAKDLSSIGTLASRVIPTGVRASTVSALFDLTLRFESNAGQLLTLAGIAKDIGQLDTSEKLARGALSKNPTSIQAMAFLALLESERDHRDQAADYSNLAISRDPNLKELPPATRARIFLLHGSVLESRGDSKATEFFKRGFKDLKATQSLNYDRETFVRLMAKAEGARSAVNWIKESAKSKPLTSNERLLLGNLLTELKEFSEAKAVLFGTNGR